MVKVTRENRSLSVARLHSLLASEKEKRLSRPSSRDGRYSQIWHRMVNGSLSKEGRARVMVMISYQRLTRRRSSSKVDGVSLLVPHNCKKYKQRHRAAKLAVDVNSRINADRLGKEVRPNLYPHRQSTSTHLVL